MHSSASWEIRHRNAEGTERGGLDLSHIGRCEKRWAASGDRPVRLVNSVFSLRCPIDTWWSDPGLRDGNFD